MEIETIQEENQNLGLKLQISLQWKDARVQFYNLKLDEQENSLTPDEKITLWTPTVLFRNTRERMRTVNDENTFARIKREGNGTMIQNDVNEDAEVFAGSENIITISREYSTQFYCNYKTAWFPFDEHTCHVEMILDDGLLDFADLVPGAVNYTGTRELSKYFVKRWDMKTRTIKDKTYVVVSISLGRRILGFFLTIYFPTILMNHLIFYLFPNFGQGH